MAAAGSMGAAGVPLAPLDPPLSVLCQVIPSTAVVSHSQVRTCQLDTQQLCILTNRSLFVQLLCRQHNMVAAICEECSYFSIVTFVLTWAPAIQDSQVHLAKKEVTKTCTVARSKELSHILCIFKHVVHKYNEANMVLIVFHFKGVIPKKFYVLVRNTVPHCTQTLSAHV